MEDFGPLIFFVIYIVFQVMAAQNKAKKKKARQLQEQQQAPRTEPKPISRPVPRPQPQVQPVPKQETPGDFFKEFLKQLEELENPKPEPKAEPYSMPEPVTMETIPPPAKSSEITTVPYSNLEQGILDSTHKSKFSHHTASTYKKKKPAKPIKLFKNVDAREAFIYSLIFERKEY